MRRRRLQHRTAFTLIEVMVAMGLSTMVALAIGLLAFFASRSFVAMEYYTDMAQKSRLALDKMSMEIRQTRRISAYVTNSVTFENLDGSSLNYTFDIPNRRLLRISGGRTNTYLTNCDWGSFWIYLHTVKSNSFDCYTTTNNVSDNRLVEVVWRCSRQILGVTNVSEDVESAKIALRNR